MEPISSRVQQAVSDEVECWDDDDDLQGFDDFHLRSASTATSINSASVHRSSHRDSISSRVSHRSDLDSNAGGDDDWQVLLPDNDEASHLDAIASAKCAGIPIPINVPKSALLGGTIKRLGGKRIKRTLGEDWSADIELPDSGGDLRLKTSSEAFPESLRQVSAESSPGHTNLQSDAFDNTFTPFKRRPIVVNLDQYKDTIDAGFLDEYPTIKVPKSRTPVRQAPAAIHLHRISRAEEPFEGDFELPDDKAPLTLSRSDVPKTPLAITQDELEIDTEWAEGSLGTRFGGTRRGKSNRSSSVSALSPSVSSCLTAESEDEGFGGLVLPEGDIKFGDMLKTRQTTPSTDPMRAANDSHEEAMIIPGDDFFSGIDVGEGDIFGSRKLNLNHNIKVKAPQPPSPSHRKATSLTFTKKTSSSATRIPRLQHHERPLSMLEPVAESGAPVQAFLRRPHSHIGGHSAHTSVTSGPASISSTSPTGPASPQRRGLSRKTSREFATEPTTNAQLLKAKRSTPALRPFSSPSKIGYQRPSSQESDGRPRSAPRSKTPVDRHRLDSAAALARKPPAPFLPAGASSVQSQHISVKTSRSTLRRYGADDTSQEASCLRANSRLLNVAVSETINNKNRRELRDGPQHLNPKRALTKPARRHNFGDGTELEIFDDLPTSASAESKFIKQPAGSGIPKTRSRLTFSQQSNAVDARPYSPQVPSTPKSPLKQDTTPRFARDTNASRNAREQRTASLIMHPRDRETTFNSHVTTNWKAQVAARSPTSPRMSRQKRTRIPGGTQIKPHLIKQIGTGAHDNRAVKGMHYNPELFRWEGNETALAGFELPLVAAPRSPKPAPALITNVGNSQGAQVVGGMVFDPQRMCWLRVAPGQSTRKGDIATISPEDDEDPFADFEDLEENPRSSKSRVSLATGTPRCANFDALNGEEPSEPENDSSDDWVIGEEFDVGPEFVRRQRAEEEKWRRKVELWVGNERDHMGDEWRWAIKAMV